MRTNVLRGDRIGVTFRTKGWTGLSTVWDLSSANRLKQILAGEFDYVDVGGSGDTNFLYFRCQSECGVSVQVTARRNYSDLGIIAAAVNSAASSIASIDQNSFNSQFVYQVQSETPYTEANPQPNVTQYLDKTEEGLFSDKTILILAGFVALAFLLRR